MFVRPKKALGQHFLKDHNIARKIVDALEAPANNVLEVGPGTGILTKYLLEKETLNCCFLDTDREAYDYLRKSFSDHTEKFVKADFLEVDPDKFFKGPYSVIGNLPYNISSQIFFKILEHRNKVPEVVAMIQREVADRISSPPGSKQYGILSVLLQAFYEIDFLFGVNPQVFDPPPKVKSAVIRLKRNNLTDLPCDEKKFFLVVKQAFNYRRKTLRNSLKSIATKPEVLDREIFNKRPEQLSTEDFQKLTQLLFPNIPQ